MLNKSAAKARTAIALGIILVITFISYLPVLKGEFLLWDDDVHVLENITIRGLDFEHIQDMFTTTVNKIYIPLTSLSFAAEYHFFGYDPFVYHFDNILLHLLVVALIFLLGRKLGLSEVAAGIAAFIFGIHPIHVESVAWITERKDVLYAAFYMAAVLSYVFYLDSFKVKGASGKKVQKKEEKVYGFLAWTTIFGVLSMLAKPMALSLPLILLLLDWFKGRSFKPQAFIEKIPLGILIAGIGWITYSAHARVPGENITQSILIWPWTFAFYLRQFFFPLYSLPLYKLPQPVSLQNIEYLFALAVLFAAVGAVAGWRRNKWVVLAVLFYFFSIFFILRFDDAKDINIVADRFMYLPSLGLCFLIGWGIHLFWSRTKKAGRGIVIVILFLLSAGLSLKTFHQSRVWNDSISLWGHQLKYNPDEPIALNNIATAFSKKKEFKDAEEKYRQSVAAVSEPSNGDLREATRRIEFLISLYQKAVEAEPYFKDAHYNLGNLYFSVERFTDAAESYKEALRIDPKFKDAHVGLGDLYVKVKDAPQAVYAYEQALRLYPDDQDLYINVIKSYTEAIKQNPDVAPYSKARSNALALYSDLVNRNNPRASSYLSLGNLYAENGDSGLALLAYRRALELNPGHVATLYNLGNLYKDQGRLDDALVFYRKALDINPRMSDAYLNMGIISGKQNDHILEKSYYQKALKADPRNGRAYFNLAFLEEMSGNMEEAVKLYQKSIEADPDNAEGYYNLGNLYAKLNKNQEALDAYRNAVSQDSRHVDARVNLSILSFQSGDFTNAVKYCDEAVALGYEAPEGYLNALAAHRKLAVSNDASVDSGGK